jgi:multidrug transporter EmrE-like cation transporter
VLVPAASLYVFGEQLRLTHVVGMVLILTGVTCLLAGD